MTAHPASTQRVVPPFVVPPERDLSVFRFVAAMRTNGTGAWSKRVYEEAIVRRRFFGRNSFVLNDPDAIRHVLIDNTGNYGRTPASVRILRPMLGDGLLISGGQAWRHQRRALAPAFTPRAIETLVPHIRSAIDEAILDLRETAARGPVDLFAVLHGLALEIAGRTMFSVGMQRHGTRLRGLVTDYAVSLGRPHLPDLLLPPRFRSPHDFARARFRRRWVAFLDEVIAMRDRERMPGASRDLLDLLAAARDPETGEGFSRAQLRDQVATMILAGHETTALTLLWSAYLLALAPGIQEQVAAEVRGAALDDASAAEHEARLPLTRAVIDEALRLYPPAYVIIRLARGPDRIAGWDIAQGDIVAVSPWVLHRHRRLWGDPDAFDPGRFLPGALAIPRYAYLPFGAGPRICIGAHFALTEATLALARLVGTFRITLPGTRPVLPAAVVTTQPDHAPAFRLDPRDG